MASQYEKFVEDYRRVPQVGDPQTAVGPPLRAAAGQGQPNPTPLPHSVPHSEPPPGRPPSAPPGGVPITPRTTPAPAPQVGR
jgi:hypothetical protein